MRSFQEFWRIHMVYMGSIFLSVLLLLSGCCSPVESSRRQPDWQRFEFTQPQMGLPFRLVFYAPDAESAALAAREAYKRVSELNEILSDYETDSELNRLARTSGQDIVVSPELWKVLVMAQQRAVDSDGAFDVSVGPLVTLWRKARRDQRLPDPDRIKEALARVGHKKIILNHATRSVHLLTPHMRLDLGGIAKGFALDEALKVLKHHGFSRALVVGGGDMAIGDPPRGKEGWKIEILHLDTQTNEPSKFILLKNCGFATSGDSSQRLELDGIRYSHIVDPRTGLGLTDHSLVYVVARDSMTADSFSTTLSVLGPVKSGILFGKLPSSVSARMLRKQKSEVEVFNLGKFPDLLNK